MEAILQNSGKEQIMNLLKNRACLKQDVYNTTLDHFQVLKAKLRDISIELAEEMGQTDKRVEVRFIDRGQFEAQIQVGGDILVFTMHTNVFNFDDNHPIHQKPYVKADESRAYCGVINVYNFLADSFKYKRMRDVGYLIARIFINKEGHFFVEGKRQLGFMYNDIGNAVLNDVYLSAIIEAAVLYAIEFDLLAPPQESIKMMTLASKVEQTSVASIQTGKRLGFQFSGEQAFM